MTDTDSNRMERRAAQRFELNLPVAVRYEGRVFPGFTQDLSARGMLFYCEASLPEGALVELTFTLPSQITLGENMPVRCRGRILRSAACGLGQRNGFAARLDGHEYLPADQDESISQLVRVAAAAAESARPLTR
jgi:hypothetical protein